MKLKVIKFIFQITISVLLVSIPVAGQDSGESSIRRAIEVLNDEIAFVKDLLIALPNKEAEFHMGRAVEDAKEAKSLAESGREGLAWIKVRQARTSLAQAGRLALGASIHRTRDKFWDLMRRAESIVPASGIQKAVRFLREAQKAGNQAEKAYNKGELRRAIELYRVATFQAEQAINLVSMPKLSTQEKVEQERQRFQELLAQAEKAVGESNNKDADRILRQAKQQIPGIQNALNRAQFVLALNLYHNTTRLLLRVLDLTAGRGQYSQLRLEEELVMVEELIDTAREKISESGNLRARYLLRMATEQLGIAQKSSEAGNQRKAFTRIDISRRLIGRALNLISGGDRPRAGDRTREELERLFTELDLMESELSGSVDHSQDLELIQTAQELAHTAESYLENQQIRFALEYIFTANQLLTLARQAQQGIKSQTYANASMDVERLSQALEEAKLRSQAAVSGEKIFLQQAELLHQRARDALVQDKPVLASEYAKIALDLLLKSMRETP